MPPGVTALINPSDCTSTRSRLRQGKAKHVAWPPVGPHHDLAHLMSLLSHWRRYWLAGVPAGAPAARRATPLKLADSSAGRARGWRHLWALQA